jgi:hypothetical protein
LASQPSAYAYRLYLVKERLLLQTHSARLIRFASFLSASAAEKRTIRSPSNRVNTSKQQIYSTALTLSISA